MIRPPPATPEILRPVLALRPLMLDPAKVLRTSSGEDRRTIGCRSFSCVSLRRCEAHSVSADAPRNVLTLTVGGPDSARRLAVDTRKESPANAETKVMVAAPLSCVLGAYSRTLANDSPDSCRQAATTRRGFNQIANRFGETVLAQFVVQVTNPQNLVWGQLWKLGAKGLQRVNIRHFRRRALHVIEHEWQSSDSSQIEPITERFGDSEPVTGSGARDPFTINFYDARSPGLFFFADQAEAVVVRQQFQMAFR